MHPSPSDITESGIYLHIPFCKQACTYCDFYFETSRKHRGDFVDKLVEEIKFWSTSGFGNDNIATIYFGGGTPSTLSHDELNRIMEALYSGFKIQPNAEITFEVNPDDITEEKLKSLKVSGVNRLSIGIQTFNASRLEFMNRAHTVDQAKNALRLIQQADLKSWTADLIYGNPGQTADDLRSDIDQLLEFHPPHISAYTLTVEPHTRLGSMVRKKLIQPAEDEQVSEQMVLLKNRLKEAGILQYEVSNYCKPGHESKHNSAYWEHKNYLGLGPSAHSFRWDENKKQATRWNNEASLKNYLSNDFKGVSNSEETLDLKTLAEERLLTGLRTVKGVSFLELADRYNYNVSNKQKEYLTKLQKDEFIEQDSDTIVLTGAGHRISDYITLELITRH